MHVVGNVGTVADAGPAAAEVNPDVVLLDFRLPDGSAPEAAAAIRSLRPAAKMIFLTREDSDAARSPRDRKSTRLNSSHTVISYAVFCLKKKKTYDYMRD